MTLRSPLSRIHYYQNKQLQVKGIPVPNTNLQLTHISIPNWTCNVVTIRNDNGPNSSQVFSYPDLRVINGLDWAGSKEKTSVHDPAHGQCPFGLSRGWAIWLGLMDYSWACVSILFYYFYKKRINFL